MNIIVEWRYDRWEVIHRSGYREELLAFRGTREEAEQVAQLYRGIGLFSEVIH